MFGGLFGVAQADDMMQEQFTYPNIVPYIFQ